MKDYVTRQNGTEPPFENEYWNHWGAGMYVDSVLKQPLFLSSQKFDAGCGWPSFFMPLSNDEVIYRWDMTHGMRRMEIRARSADIHLGHVFDDGPMPTGLRYCLNSVALEFIAAEKFSPQQSEMYLPLLKTPGQFITLAGGCFWGMQYHLQRLQGVLQTFVGYTQGEVSFPTYQEVCSGRSGHVEAILVHFDPQVLKLEEIFNLFWRLHDPTTLNRQGADRGTQYRSGIYCFDSHQQELAQFSKQQFDESGVFAVPCVTEIKMAQAFYFAEDYHQKYYHKKYAHSGGVGPVCHILRAK